MIRYQFLPIAASAARPNTENQKLAAALAILDSATVSQNDAIISRPASHDRPTLPGMSGEWTRNGISRT